MKTTATQGYTKLGCGSVLCIPFWLARAPHNFMPLCVETPEHQRMKKKITKRRSKWLKHSLNLSTTKEETPEHQRKEKEITKRRSKWFKHRLSITHENGCRDPSAS